MITIQSPFSVKETIDRLAALLQQKSITIYALELPRRRIDPLITPLLKP